MNFFFVLYKLDVIFFLIGRWFGSIVCLVGWKLMKRKEERRKKVDIGLSDIKLVLFIIIFCCENGKMLICMCIFFL